MVCDWCFFFFFFQAEDGIRDADVTGVQTCALPISGQTGLGFPESVGGQGNPGGAIAAFETMGHHDLSLLVKCGVQFGLFGGAIHHLGNEEHHRKYLRGAYTAELPGCFAMTESGHGSNVQAVETIATYDREASEWVVHTPTPS